MSRPRNRLSILLIVVAMLLAFLAGTMSSMRAEIHALTPGQWAAVQASNALLLDEGPTSIYLPLVLR